MQTINIGTAANDGTGDPLRTAFTKVNDNFTEVAANGPFFIATPGQDPNGVITATRPALAYDASGAIWIKTGAGNNNTGWEQRL